VGDRVWVYLIQDRDHYWIPVDVVKKLLIAEREENILEQQATTKF